MPCAGLHSINPAVCFAAEIRARQLHTRNTGTTYQWRHLELPEAGLKKLERQFFESVAPRFGFTPPG